MHCNDSKGIGYIYMAKYTGHRALSKRAGNVYLVLQGLPTTITLTLREATAFRAFPCQCEQLLYEKPMIK